MSRLLYLLAASTAALSATVTGPSTTLRVANKEISPDGFSRSAVLAEGIHPAPLITGKKASNFDHYPGDKFNVKVVNQLTDDTMLRGTSIHWHGFLQHGTPYQDGPSGVTQCPIAPNHEYTYKFHVPDQAGTFWYHSHYGTQYCDGLRGPLVVYDPKDPHKGLYDVDDESTVITLTEWYHIQSPNIAGPAIADATLINGKGRYIGGPLVDLAVLAVEYGRRYRFRLVSASCDPNFVFSIDNHPLTIIEADGESVQPHTVDSIQIFAGQRYSFVLYANQKVDNYWVRALPNTGTNGLATGFQNGTNSAILRYHGAPKADPKSTPLSNPHLLEETGLHPVAKPQAPGPPNSNDDPDVHRLNLALGFDLATQRFTVNGKSYTSPTVPVLLQMMSGKKRPEELMPKGSVFTLPLNKTIEVTVPAGVIGGPHPFHLHGHVFSVIRSAGTNATTNYINPVKRDVVSLGDTGSNVTIRFRTDNPGPWLFHCHIDFHLETGLAIVFAEDSGQGLSFQDPPPAEWDKLCPTYDALPASATSVRLLSTPAAAPTHTA